MIKLSRHCDNYFINDIAMTIDDGATIYEIAECLRCFLLGLGYHHNLVEEILPSGDD